MSPESPKQRLPFEPKSKKKKPPKKAPVSQGEIEPKNISPTKEVNKPKSSAIPEIVSRRMLKRMAIFSGVPTILGVLSFVLFYWLVSQNDLKIPTSAVVLVSMGFFGLGVLGLSYGLLSTCWDEDRLGSWWGWQEFSLNFGRMTTAWQSSKKTAKGN